ncbi:MAG: bifunctional transaldolase/phosoglucose isomerase [Bacteroidales bacterium]|nr:bifunctional transaldolase/phosoglucose isomerase [Bacteroidales bacterium]
MNPLQELHKFGQSPWMDYIRRDLFASGKLKRLISNDGISGVTSNPSIFEKAIAHSDEYQDAILKFSGREDINAKDIFESLEASDIQNTADTLRPIYDATNRRDGYVSMEVSPRLGHDGPGTLNEARRLWAMVDRPNLLVKVPATAEGIPVIQKLISEGINVNVTLLFSQDTYVQVAEAFIKGLEIRAAKGGDISGIASVASVFVSRIDALVDELIDANGDAQLQAIKGKVAIANSRLCYQEYKNLFSGDKWQALADKGANTQRLLWASTSTKNPDYKDTLYMDELIGPDTVNTIPPVTMDAFRDHGTASNTLENDIDGAKNVLQTLEGAGISMEKVTDQLLKEGLQKFVVAFDSLLKAVDTARNSNNPTIGTLTSTLPADLSKSVDAAINDWTDKDKVKRLWARDPWLWTGEDEAFWLDWLNVVREQMDQIGNLTRVLEGSEGEYIKHLVLLGMGGSSLAPDMLRNTFGSIDHHPELLVLDSTDPAQIKQIEEQLDYTRTKFLVSSKSGSTLEPNIFKEYFFTRASKALGSDAAAANNFFVVTDPGSALQKLAEKEGFHRIFYGLPGIGGRYSALSNFGMVPGSAMGINIRNFIELTMLMVDACSADVAPKDNPGVILGTILGSACVSGRDKVTLIASPGIQSIGAWLEQLLAESTGKEGHGIIPVDGEALLDPEQYGDDRVFAYLRLTTDPDAAQDAAVKKLKQAGHPVVQIDVPHIYNMGQELFRWEIATAVAGSIIEIDAFNQPDVEASKIVTKDLTNEYEKSGSLPAETPMFEEDGIALYTDDKNAAQLRELAGDGANLADYIKAHLNRISKADYFAILGFVNRFNPVHGEAMQAIRTKVQNKFKVATCLGFGPRFLHSTGQAYKGGPNSGVFLQITCDDANDLQVPNHKYTFGVVKAAQARGDFSVLAERNRRALRVHLGKDTEAGFKQLEALVNSVL